MSVWVPVRTLLVAAAFGSLFVPVAGAITPTPTPTVQPCGAVGANGITCEAENAVRGGGVVVSTLHAGYTGTGFADYQGNGSGYVEWTVSVPTAGTYQLTFRYGNGGTTDRPMAIAVNGTTVVSSMSFPSTTTWTNWMTRSQNVPLPPGLVRIRATELPNGPNVDNLSVKSVEVPTPTYTSTPTVTATATPTFTSTRTPTPPAPTPDACSVGVTCEAESAARGGGVTVSTLHAGYTGTGFADYAGNGTGYVEWSVTVPAAGAYRLAFRYGNGGTTDRPMQITANGTVVSSSLSFPSTTTWTNWLTSSVNATLPAGIVKIRATELPNGPNVDNLMVTAITPTPTGTPWATGYMRIDVSKVDPKVGEKISVTVSGNTGLGSFVLSVQGDPVFAETPAASPSGGTSYTWTLTAAKAGTATFVASIYGETQNGCSSCFIYRTVSSASSAVTVVPTTAPTPTPAPQGFVSNNIWYNFGQDMLVRADTTSSAYAPTWSIKVIDTTTGLEQDAANPIVTISSQGPATPAAGSGSLQWWKFTPVRSGTVRFQTSVNAEYPCGSGCYAYRTVTATSWSQSVP
jgi:hypothetical protein